MAAKNTMRLDKLLTMLGEGTRAQAKDYVRAGRVTVNGVPARDSGMQVDAENARVCLNGRALEYKAVRHVMMNKPQGTLTAARDKRQKTVMDLLPPLYAAMDCMPAGRLDKDTEGLLIITSDGQLAHRIISPKKDVTKVYFARVDGVLDESDIAAFAAGLHIKDSDGEFDARPAGLEIVYRLHFMLRRRRLIFWFPFLSGITMFRSIIFPRWKFFCCRLNSRCY